MTKIESDIPDDEMRQAVSQIKNDVIYLTEVVKGDRNFLNKHFQNAIMNYFMEDYASQHLKDRLKAKTFKEVRYAMDVKLKELKASATNCTTKYMGLINLYYTEHLENNSLQAYQTHLLSLALTSDVSSVGNLPQKGTNEWATSAWKRATALFVYHHSQNPSLSSIFEIWNSLFPEDPIVKKKKNKDERKRDLQDKLIKESIKQQDNISNNEESSLPSKMNKTIQKLKKLDNQNLKGNSILINQKKKADNYGSVKQEEAEHAFFEQPASAMALPFLNRDQIHTENGDGFPKFEYQAPGQAKPNDQFNIDCSSPQLLLQQNQTFQQHQKAQNCTQNMQQQLSSQQLGQKQQQTPKPKPTTLLPFVGMNSDFQKKSGGNYLENEDFFTRNTNIFSDMGIPNPFLSNNMSSPFNQNNSIMPSQQGIFGMSIMKDLPNQSLQNNFKMNNNFINHCQFNNSIIHHPQKGGFIANSIPFIPQNQSQPSFSNQFQMSLFNPFPLINSNLFESLTKKPLESIIFQESEKKQKLQSEMDERDKERLLLDEQAADGDSVVFHSMSSDQLQQNEEKKPRAEIKKELINSLDSKEHPRIPSFQQSINNQHNGQNTISSGMENESICFSLESNAYPYALIKSLALSYPSVLKQSL